MIIETNITHTYSSGDGHHIRFLDAFKGIAISGTVLVHATDPFRAELPRLLGNFTYEGARGVQMLFMISAFLAFRSLNRNQGGPHGIFEYLKWVASRYVRLAPLFWLLLISQFTLCGWDHYINNTEDLIGALSAIFLLHGLSPRYHVKFWAPGWYIGTLFLFDLFAPYLAKKIKSLHTAVYFFVASLVCGYGVSRLLEVHIPNIPFFKNDPALATTFLFDWLPFQLPVLSLGIILYFLLEKLQESALWNRKAAYELLFISLAAFAVLIDMCPSHGAAIYGFSAAFFGILVSQAIQPCRIFVNPLWETLGRRSYEIYIMHTIVLGFLTSLDFLSFDNVILRTFLYVILCLAGSWLAGILLDYLFERPLKWVTAEVRNFFRQFKRSTRHSLYIIAAIMVIPVFSAMLILGNKENIAIMVAAVYLLLLGAIWLLVRWIGQSHILQKMQKNGFLFSVLVKRDFTKKYKRTALGIAWSMLSPLLQLLVMWLVFKRFFGNNMDHYVVYLFAGQLVFSFFTDSTNSGMEALLGNSDIFTKVNVPKYLFLLSKNVSSFINFSLTLVIFFIFVGVDGLAFSWKYVLLLYPILCLMIFNIGTGFVLSAMYVFFRDIQYLWGVFTLLLMYMSAIFYTIDGYPPFARNLFLLNPIYVYIRYFRKIVIDGTIPTIWFHLVAAGYALIMISLGAWVYKKFNHEFLYYV